MEEEIKNLYALAEEQKAKDTAMENGAKAGAVAGMKAKCVRFAAAAIAYRLVAQMRSEAK